jgi:hypothetical protein
MAYRKYLLLAALVLAVPFFAPGDALAGHDNLTTYYTGSCPYNLTYNGYHYTECDSSTSQDGTLDGTWKSEDWYDCQEATFMYWWYEKCNGTWVLRYGNSINQWPLPEQCHCT